MAAINASVSTSLARRMSSSGSTISLPSSSRRRARGVIGAEHDAGEALAAVDRRDGLGAGEMAGEAVPVLGAGQRAVDAGGADLQRPGAGDRVLHVQHRAERVADRLAIGDGDLAAVGAVGHHLHRRAVAAEHGDAHEFVAHAFERGRDDGGQPGFQAGVARSSDRAVAFSKQKRRPVKATPRNSAENDL